MKWDQTKGVLYSDDGEKLGVINPFNNNVRAKFYLTGKVDTFARRHRAVEWLENQAKMHGK